MQPCVGSCGLMEESRTRNRVRVSVWQGLSVGNPCGVNVQCSLHLHYHDWGALEHGTEPSTAPRAPQHKWLPTCVCVCVCVCVCARACVCACVERAWMGKCRARILSMGHYTWLHAMSLSLNLIYKMRHKLAQIHKLACLSHVIFNWFMNKNGK